MLNNSDKNGSDLNSSSSSSETDFDLNSLDGVDRYLSYLLFQNDNIRALQDRLNQNASSFLNMTGSYDWTPLHYAVYARNSNALNLLFAHGATKIVNKVDEKGATPLLIAASRCQADIILSLIQNGAHTDALLPDWQNALHVACHIKNMYAVNVFSQYRSLINSADERNRTPIFYTTGTQYKDIFQRLVSSGANLKHRDIQGWNIFHFLCHKNNLEGFKIAMNALQFHSVKQRACNKKNNDRCAPIHIAAAYCSLDFIIYLSTLKNIIRIDAASKDRTILHFACAHNSPEVISYIANLYPSLMHHVDSYGQKPWDILMKRDFIEQDVRIKSYFAKFPYITWNKKITNYNTLPPEVKYNLNLRFFRAITCNDIGGIKYFLINKIEVAIHFRGKNDMNALHVAAHHCDIKILQLFLQYKDLIFLTKERNAHGALPLHSAAQFSLADAIPSLLIYNYYDARDNYGCNPLHYAFFGNNLSNVDYLLQKYPNLMNKSDRHGNVPIFHLCYTKKDSTSILENLKSKEVDFNITNKDNDTLLHFASQVGKIDMVSFLCREFSDLIHKQNQHGLYPLHTACLYGKAQVVKILLQNGADVNAVDAQGNSVLSQKYNIADRYKSIYEILIQHNAAKNKNAQINPDDFLNL